MAIGIIIQARLGSTRLPHKMVKPFYEGKGVLELLIQKIKLELPDLLIVVATSTNPVDDKIQDICEIQNINYHRGSEENVLQRFVDTAKKFEIDKIVRVCADNPFLNIPALKELIDLSQHSNSEYLSFQTSENKPTIMTHYGFWAEMVTLNALQKVTKLTSENSFLEHVTNFIYSNPKKFKLEFIPISKAIEDVSNIRMTLDTPEDFELLSEIYSRYPIINENLETFVQLIRANSNWIKRMEQQIITNTK